MFVLLLVYVAGSCVAHHFFKIYYISPSAVIWKMAVRPLGAEELHSEMIPLDPGGSPDTSLILHKNSCAWTKCVRDEDRAGITFGVLKPPKDIRREISTSAAWLTSRPSEVWREDRVSART